jgi:hypothetical protein
LTFRLLPRSKEFQAKLLAGGVLKGPGVLAKKCLCIRVADGNDLAVGDIVAKYIEVSIQEPTFSLGERIERFGLIRFHNGDRLQEHGPGFVGFAVLAWLLCESRWRERKDRGRRRSDHEFTNHGFPPCTARAGRMRRR